MGLPDGPGGEAVSSATALSREKPGVGVVWGAGRRAASGWQARSRWRGPMASTLPPQGSLRGAPREPLSWSYSSAPPPIPLGSEKWQRKSGCPCGSGRTQTRPAFPATSAHALDRRSPGAPESCLSPSPGPPSWRAASPHAPGTLGCDGDAPSPDGQGALASSSPAPGHGKEEGKSSDPPAPTFPLRPRALFVVTAKWRPGHWAGRAAIRGWGVRPRRGVEECHIDSHSYTGNSGGWDRGALGHSPSMKENQAVNV